MVEIKSIPTIDDVKSFITQMLSEVCTVQFEGTCTNDFEESRKRTIANRSVRWTSDAPFPHSIKYFFCIAIHCSNIIFFIISHGLPLSGSECSSEPENGGSQVSSEPITYKRMGDGIYWESIIQVEEKRETTLCHP